MFIDSSQRRCPQLFHRAKKKYGLNNLNSSSGVQTRQTLGPWRKSDDSACVCCVMLFPLLGVELLVSPSSLDMVATWWEELEP